MATDDAGAGRSPARIGRHVAGIAILAAIYFGSARLGLRFATVERSVTLVWPPAGLSLVALQLFGRRLWPGVALGAFLVNALTPGVSPATAAGMALGNTLEAVIGAELLRRSEFIGSLERIGDVLRLITLAAVLSTVVGATFGSLSLWLGGVIPAPAVAGAGRAWWLGDMTGDLIFAPLLFTWLTTRRISFRPLRLLEAAAIASSLAVLLFFIFLRGDVGIGYPYAIFPFLVWAALRFGPRGVATTIFVEAAASIYCTANGVGPFVRPSLDQSLLVLQVFTGIAAVTSLVLGAAVAERNRAIRLRDEFISIASHELKTPLTPLKLQVQMLRRLLESGSLTNADPQRISRMAMTSERQIDRLQRLVADMLDVSRAHSGQFTLEREAFDLAALARDTLETFEAELAQAHSQADLHFDIPVVGTWDRLRIQQVIANLVGNAIKFGRGLPISVSVDAEPDRARLIVEDHGLGIALDDQGRIFNRFERAVAARHFAGMGLGLYIARQIVDAHGGTIRVESTPQSGSRFIVELPLQEAVCDRKR